MRPHYLIAMAAAVAWTSVAWAQTPPAQEAVAVSFGPTLEKKAADFGPGELQNLSADLRDAVQHAMAHARSPQPVHVDLVIDDAVPNHPTLRQLSRTPGLSLRSVGLGGARISGTATYADGTQRPIREQFWETDLRDIPGVDTWYDANRAFDQVAYDIGHGKLPANFRGPGASGQGHFGYPFTDQP